MLVAGFLTSWWVVQRSMPQTEGSVELEGLDGKVTVLRDASGIPQVYADTADDLFFAQGYVQAQDRFFEMDFRRHLAAGRLSELFGEDALKADMFVRTLGLRRVAEKELALLSPRTRRYLDQFADGVNAYLAGRQGADLSLEYALLGLQRTETTPEPWEAADSLSWLKAVAWQLGSNMREEAARALLSTRLDRRQIEALYPPYPYEQNQPIVTQGAVVDGVYEQDATQNDSRLPKRVPYTAAREPLRRARSAGSGLDELLGSGDGLGSNAWAVSGGHTESGAPLLANDPHLMPSLPGAWYQMGLHCNDVTPECPFDVSGFSFAGLPGIVVGHNAHIAWGLSNLYPDVQDLYLEKVRGDSAVYDGRREPLTTRQETFEVAGSDDVTITVRESRHGPLVSDVDEDLARVGTDALAASKQRDRSGGGEGLAVALQWSALTPGRTADALFGIDAATNWDEFREAVRWFDAPSQNIVYADTDGHIGYQAPGRIPVRRSGNGDWPVPGWDPAYDWTDQSIPYDALPRVLDPKDGYVVAANQEVAPQRYPYHLGTSFDYGYRAERIRTLLAGREDLTVEDMTEIQLDDHSTLARHLTPVLLSIELEDDYYQRGQETLARWDFTMSADSPGAAYFNAVWRNLLTMTFADQLPEDLLPQGGSRWWAVMDRLVDRPDDAFWDDVDTTDRVERRDDILYAALQAARDELTELISRNPADWRWGMLHQLTLRNPALGVPGSAVGTVFNRGPYSLSGGPLVANATSWNAARGYQVTAVPTMRMVVPLDDLDGARWVNLTGASGHAYADHYTDQTELWASGQTLPWSSSRAEVRRATEHQLMLTPAG